MADGQVHRECPQPARLSGLIHILLAVPKGDTQLCHLGLLSFFFFSLFYPRHPPIVSLRRR
jgi:hypothetical protein